MIALRRTNFPAYATLAAALTLGLVAGTATRAADAPATQPDIAETLRLLTAGNDATTPDALARVQAAVAQQTRQVIAAQQVILRLQRNLAQQLRIMTGARDADAQARVAGLLEFNAAVYRWAIDSSNLPDEQRDAVLEWGLKEENLPLIAKVYGRDPDAKIEAIKAVAAQEPGTATDRILQLLLTDRDREVSLLTIDAIYDRKPSTGMMDALCDKTFGWLLNQYRQRNPQQQHTVTVHGRTITFYDNPNQNNFNQQDADIAADLLIKYKDPHVAERFDNFFWELLVQVSSNTNGNIMNDGRLMQVISPNYGGAQAIGRLIDAYKPKNAVMVCVKILESNAVNFNSNDPMVNIDNQQVRMHSSSRLDVAAMLIRVTGQDVADYGLTVVPNYGNRWMIRGGAAEENDIIKKLRAWLTDHAKDYGIDAPGAFPEAPVAPAGRRGGVGMP